VLKIAYIERSQEIYADIKWVRCKFFGRQLAGIY
jgi:hypothetical protein